MKSPTRRALTISLCLHLVALIVTISVVRQELREQFADLLVADIFTAPQTRVPAPRIQVEQIVLTPRRQVGKTPRLITPKRQPVNQTEHLLRPTSTVSLDRPRHFLDAAQVSQTTETDLSTVARDLRTDETTLPQAEAAVPSGTGNRGLKKTGGPGVQRARNRASIYEAAAANGDSITERSDLRLDLGPGSAPEAGFDLLMKGLAEKIVASSDGGPIDVVLVVDSSGSMGDNIRAVAAHLIDMIDVYNSTDIDYALGLTEFWAPGKPPVNKIKVHQLTKSLNEYKQALLTITPRQDENALDAINQTVHEMRFRPTSMKHLIVVTDEPFTSLKQLTTDTVIALCREFDIHVNVLGLNNADHKKLADETEGHWHVIPEDPLDRSGNSRRVRLRNSRHHLRSLRNAKWADVTEVGKISLQDLAGNTLDVILFIDGSRSMEDKLPKFLTQLEIMIRDWDNALIDYRIGVVRFRAGLGEVNYVNVYQPPQTMASIRKIVNLPCQGNERLLDAIVEGLERIELRAEAQPYLICVTDEPSTGKYSPQAVIQLCRTTGVKVSVIGTYDTFQQEVTVETGGIWAPIPNGKRTNRLNW